MGKTLVWTVIKSKSASTHLEKELRQVLKALCQLRFSPGNFPRKESSYYR